MTACASRPYRGVFPVVPTIFHDDGELDLEGQKRAVDFMIDAGSQGVCILANFSEQFSLTDDERTLLARTLLEHVAGRVPVIVTTTHFSSRACAQRSRAYGQRVRKRQPDGGEIGLGTSPCSSIRSRRNPGCGSGMAESSACV